MLKGLHLYEIIFLFGGGIFLLVLLFLLVWSVVKKGNTNGLLPYFLGPVVMIGWPTITSFSYENGKVTIQKNANAVIANPADTTARKQLEKEVASFDTARAAGDPAALNEISKAYYALGRYDESAVYNKKVLQLDSNSADAKKMQKAIQYQIQTKRLFNSGIRQLDAINANHSVADTVKAKEVIKILKATPVPVYTDEKSSLVLAKSLASVNEKEQSIQVVNKVIKANPASAEAVQLKKEIEQGKYVIRSADTLQAQKANIKKFNTAVVKYRPQ